MIANPIADLISAPFQGNHNHGLGPLAQVAPGAGAPYGPGNTRWITVPEDMVPEDMVPEGWGARFGAIFIFPTEGGSAKR